MFEWDAFNESEVTAHRVLPSEAEDVFSDAHRRPAPGYVVDGEQRFYLTGQTSRGRILTVVYTWRGSRIRVVTAYSQYGRRRRDYLEGHSSDR
jgi:uncharacterized DUF497 family protein